MLIKVVSLFLIGIVGLAMFGRLRWPGGAAKPGSKARGKKGETPDKPVKCKSCGAYKVGPGPCVCEKGR